MFSELASVKERSTVSSISVLCTRPLSLSERYIFFQTTSWLSLKENLYPAKEPHVARGRQLLPDKTANTAGKILAFLEDQ